MMTNPRLDENTKQLFVKGLGMRSATIIPLVAGDQWIGFVLGLSSKVYQMNEGEVRQIVSLAGQAATVAQSQRLYEAAQSRAQHEQILREVSARITAAADAESVLQIATREIGRALGLETFVYLKKTQTDQ
jgi:GAF domain-containing protein